MNSHFALIIIIIDSHFALIANIFASKGPHPQASFRVHACIILWVVIIEMGT